MPAIHANSRILLTGANGFLGAWIARTFLENGHSVRATVRRSSAGQYLSNLFEREFPGKFEFVIVEDIQNPELFEAPLKGIDAVVHSASPVKLNVEDMIRDMVEPAVNGTLTVVKASLKQNTSAGGHVRRIIFTSSSSAVLEPRPIPYTYDEKDWHENAIEVMNTKGNKMSPTEAYDASKTLAEKNIWEFAAKHPESGFDIVTICPPWIIGPTIHDFKDWNDLVEPFQLLWPLIDPQTTAEEKINTSTLEPRGSQVDVRDVALLHLKAAEAEVAGGERFTFSAVAITLQDILDPINTEGGHRALAPKYSQQLENVALGKPGAGAAVNEKQTQLSGEKARKILGLEPRDFEQTAVDMVRAMWDRMSAMSVA